MDTNEQQQLLHDVNAFCEEIRPHEELCYLEHKFNDQLVPLAKKYNILGMPVPKAYGGRGASAVAYLRALARIGREGTRKPHASEMLRGIVDDACARR